MAYDSLSLSQPLRGGGYNEYLLGKMQNKGNPQAAVQQVEQNLNQRTLMDNVSSFASELRSQNLVRAMAEVQKENYGMPPTLAEKGANIDSRGNVTMPQENVRAKALTEQRGISIEPQRGIAFQGVRAFALDSRSLTILSNVAKREENPELFRRVKNPLQKKFDEISEKYSLGSLSKKYESAQGGSQSIGYDRNGGTSYGTYQLSSRAGTFSRFLQYLEEKEPEWAKELKNAGSANTGGRTGAVPAKWKELCAQNPERMQELEHSFIVKSHFEPVMNYVRENWKGSISPALKEVIFSTAVQHGVSGAKHIVDQALSAMKNSPQKRSAEQDGTELLMAAFDGKTEKNAEPRYDQAEFIKNIYANRKNKFSSSTLSVQEAAKNRFIWEQKDALAMLA